MRTTFHPKKYSPLRDFSSPRNVGECDSLEFEYQRVVGYWCEIERSLGVRQNRENQKALLLPHWETGDRLLRSSLLLSPAGGP